MQIELSNAIILDLSEFDNEIVVALKKHFRVKSPEYIDSDNKRSFTEDEKYIKMYDIADNKLYLPRGVMDEVEAILYDYDISFDDIEIVDNRLLLEDLDFPEFKFDLYPHQKAISSMGYRLSQGTFQAGCGSGKTITLLKLIAKCRQPALVIVPDKSLQKQWLENVQNVFGFKYKSRRDNYIGLIGDGEYDYKDKYIVIATVQTIYSHLDDKELFNSFGFVCMDECHLCGAMSFRTSIHLFPAYYRYGATATMFRNDNLGSFIEDYIGKCFYRVTDEQLETNDLLIKPKMVKVPTNFHFKVNFKYNNWYMTMSSYLIKDMARNRLIVSNIIEKSIKCNRIALIVSTRVNHCVILAGLIQKQCPKIKIGILVGDEADLRGLNFTNIETFNVEEKARNGELDLVFGVNKVKTGLDIPPLEDVHVVAPYKSQVITTQVVGRVMRPSDCFGKYKHKSEKLACVYDYVDIHVDVLNNQYNEWRKPIYEERCEIVDTNKKRRQRNGTKSKRRTSHARTNRSRS